MADAYYYYYVYLFNIFVPLENLGASDIALTFHYGVFSLPHDEYST